MTAGRGSRGRSTTGSSAFAITLSNTDFDESLITEFEEDLKGNLFKLWNRLSSGSYFPPPVRGVEIPKSSGGTRMLGVPTVADRIAQTVVCMVLEPAAEPVFHPDSYGYRPGRSALHAVAGLRT